MPPNNVLWNIIRWSEEEDRPVQKLCRINKEKDFWEWTRKRINLEDRLPAKPDPLRCPTCVGLCAAFAGRVRKHPLTPMQAPVGLFLRGLWKGGVFRVSVGHPGLGEIKTPYTNQPHLTSSMTHPKRWFSSENRGDTWGRKWSRIKR